MDANSKQKDSCRQTTLDVLEHAVDKQEFELVKEVWTSIKAIADYFQEGNKLLQKFMPQVEEAIESLEVCIIILQYERENIETYSLLSSVPRPLNNKLLKSEKRSCKRY